MSLLGPDGKKVQSIDESKLSKSKRKCISSGTLIELMQIWGNDEVDDRDVQTFLLFQIAKTLMELQIGSKPIIVH